MTSPTQASVVYQAQGKLMQLAYEASLSRSLTKPEIKEKINQGVSIGLRLQALGYGSIIPKDVRDKIWYCLQEIADINSFPVAPVLGQIQPPNINIGGGGNTTIIINNSGGGVPFQQAGVTGTVPVDSLPIASGYGAVWYYTVRKTGNQRSGIYEATWLPDGSAFKVSHTSTQDIGNTTSVGLNIDFNGGNVRLLAVASTSGWTLEGSRFIIYAIS